MVSAGASGVRAASCGPEATLVPVRNALTAAAGQVY